MTKDLPPAPDFDLGPLIGLPNDFLMSSDLKKRAANAFILALSCAFNDLKGVMLFAEQHSKWKQPDGRATAYNGQMRAINIQIHRLAVGTIHELMELLRKSKQELLHPDVQVAVKNLSKAQADSWRTIISIANDPRRRLTLNGSMAAFLHMVRNKTAFHYDKKYIMNGYEAWLKQAKTSPCDANKFAYVSLGKNAEETRFFFADAGTDTQFASELASTEITQKQPLRDLIMEVNQALRFVISSYLFPKKSKM